MYDRTQKHIFENVDAILSELVTDVASQVIVDHEDTWKTYDGVGSAFHAILLKMNGKTDECKDYAIAASLEHGKWAAGFGETAENREFSAKLALAVSIATGTPDEEP